jgi:capsular exopolysaccharide synthesis family protein
MGRLESRWNNNPGALSGQSDPVFPTVVNSAQVRPQSEDSGGAILGYWQLIKRRKRLVFVTAVLGAITAFIVLVVQQPIYLAGTTLELQGFNESFMNLSAVDPLAGNYAINKDNINTEIRILLSASMRGPVADRLRRETAPMTPPKGGVLSPLRELVRGREDPLLEMRKGISIAAGTLRAQVLLGTHIINISCESTIPDIASAFANAVAAEYMAQNSQQRTISTQKMSQWLETQLEETRVKVEQAENRLQDFVRKSGGTFVGDEKETLASTRLKQLQADLVGMQASRIVAQAKYERIKSSPPDSLPDVVNDALYQQYQGKLVQLRQDLATLNLTLTSANPKVQKVQEQIVETTAEMEKEKEIILQRAQTDYDNVLRNEKLLASAYAGQAGTVTSQSDKTAQYAQLKREVDLYQGTLNSMLSQVNQSAIASALPTTNARVIDPAVTPQLPYKPDAQTYELYGVLGGSFAGVLLILVIDQLSKWRSSLIFGMPGYSPRILKVPELGVIPSIESARGLEESFSGKRWTRLLPGASRGLAEAGSGRKWTRLLPSSAAQPIPAVPLSATSNGSIHAESFRLTLTSILLMSRRGRQPKIIVVTSPGPGEGKTTVVSHMAIAIAESGRKVLIIDSDLRRPRMHTIFGLENNEGLGEIITSRKANGNGSARPAPTVCQTHIDGVFVLPSGTVSDVNLSQIFHSPEIPALLDKLEEQFDLILIDTPPMIQFSDARLMARFADGLILVVRSGITARESAVAARDQLAQDNINVLGTILNDWDARTNIRQQYHPYYNSYTESQKTPAASQKTRSEG